MKKNNSFTTLPNGFKEVYHFGGPNDKALTLQITLLSFVMIMPLLMLYVHINKELFWFFKPLDMIYFAVILMVSFLMVLFIHELLFVLILKKDNQDIKFKIKGLFLSTNTGDYYFKKRHYLKGIVITHLLMYVFLLLGLFLFKNAWSIFYFLIVFHLAAYFGDAFTIFQMLKHKKCAIVKESRRELYLYEGEDVCD